jgi:hypothetical protein
MATAKRATKTIQQELADQILEIYTNSIVKKIDKDNFLDIHIPEINKKKGTHLFFNTAKDNIKIGFYCREEEFINEVINREFDSIEAASNGLRIKGNPVYTNVITAVKAAFIFLKSINKNESFISNIDDSESNDLVKGNNDELIDAFVENFGDDNLSGFLENYLESDKTIVLTISRSDLESATVNNVDYSDNVQYLGGVELNDWKALSKLIGKSESDWAKNEFTAENPSGIVLLYSEGKYVYAFSNPNDLELEDSDDNDSDEDYDNYFENSENEDENENDEDNAEVDIDFIVEPVNVDTTLFGSDSDTYFGNDEDDESNSELEDEDYDSYFENSDDESIEDNVSLNIDKDTIPQILEEIDANKKIKHFQITYYTREYSDLNYSLVYKVNSSNVQVNRVNWYNDSYWTGNIERKELIEGLNKYYNGEIDGSELIDNYFDRGIVEYEFNRAGNFNNGVDFQITDIDDLTDIPDDLQDDEGNLDVWELSNNYVSEEEELYDDNVGSVYSYQIEINDQTYELVKDEICAENEEEDEDCKVSERWKDESPARIKLLFDSLLALLSHFHNRGSNDDGIQYFMVEFENIISSEIILSNNEILDKVRNKVIKEWDEKDEEEWIERYSSAYEVLINDFNLVSEINKSLIKLSRMPVENSEDFDFSIISVLRIPLTIFPSSDIVNNERDSQLALYSLESNSEISEYYDFINTSYKSLGILLVSNDDLFGVIDKNGNLIIECEYDKIVPTNVDKYWCLLDGSWVLLNNQSKIIAKSNYDDLVPAVEGLCYAKKNNLCGVINDKGEEIIPVVYENILPFNDELTAVFDNGNYIFYNKLGEKKDFPQIERIRIDYNTGNWLLNEGAINVRINGQNCFLNTDGIVIGNFYAPHLYSFSNGYTSVNSDSTNGIMDLKGNIYFNNQYDYVNEPVNGLFSVIKDNFYGVINIDGEIIIPIKYDYLSIYDDNLILCNLEGKEILYDSNGNVILDFKDGITINPSENITESDKAWLNIDIDDKRGFYNMNTKKTIEFQYDWSTGGFDHGIVTVEKDEKFGYVNTEGILIGGQFFDGVAYQEDEDTAFKENFSYVKKGEKYAFLSINGTLKTKFIYNSASQFQDGYAIVSDKNDLFGVIDTKFNFVIKCKYSSIKRIGASKPLFIANYEGMFGIIDIKDTVVLNFLFDEIAHIDDNLYYIEREKIGMNSLQNQMVVPYNSLKYGLLDVSNNEITPFIYDQIEHFHDDLFKVRLDQLFGIINNKGKVIIKVKYGEIELNDQFLICELNGKKSIFDLSGNKILNDEYDNIYINEGIILIVNDYLQGAFTQSGKKILPIEYNQLQFSENIFLVKKEGVYQYFDINGKLISDKTFEKANVFCEGLALVNNENKYSFINTNGEIKITTTYDKVESFENGLSVFEIDDQYGLMDKEGNEVLSANFQEIRINDNYFVVQKDDFSGVLDVNFNILIDFKFDNISLIETAYLVSLTDEDYNTKYGLYDLKGNETVPVQYDDITFQNNYFIVNNDYKYGLINVSGKNIIPIKYDEIVVENNFIKALKKDKIHLFDFNGNPKGDLKFDRIDDFTNGYALVGIKDKYGFINNLGELEIPAIYDGGFDFSNGIADVENNGKWGFINTKGEVVVPLKYDSVSNVLNSDLIIVKLEDKFGIINQNNEIKLPITYNNITDKIGDVIIAGTLTEQTIQVDNVNTFIINDDQNSFTIGYNTNCYVSEDVAGYVPDETLINALSSEDTWSNYAFYNDWYDMDGFMHTHGIIEPATDVLLSDGTISSITINYTPVNLDLEKYAFDESDKGDFIQIACSDEKSYGWGDWKKYTITFEDLGNYSSPLLNLDCNINGFKVKGVFDVRKIRTNFDYNIVSSYTYFDDLIDFDEDENYTSTGKGFNSNLYYNDGSKLISIDLEELREGLENANIAIDDIEQIKQFISEVYSKA